MNNKGRGSKNHIFLPHLRRLLLRELLRREDPLELDRLDVLLERDRLVDRLVLNPLEELDERRLAARCR
jgi:hypothetical protein